MQTKAGVPAFTTETSAVTGFPEENRRAVRPGA